MTCEDVVEVVVHSCRGGSGGLGEAAGESGGCVSLRREGEGEGKGGGRKPTQYRGSFLRLSQSIHIDA